MSLIKKFSKSENVFCYVVLLHNDLSRTSLNGDGPNSGYRLEKCKIICWMLGFKDPLPYCVGVRSMVEVALAGRAERLEHRSVDVEHRECKLVVHRSVREPPVLGLTEDLVRTKYFQRARRQERLLLCSHNEQDRVAVDDGRRLNVAH